MPDIDGYEVITELKKNEKTRNIPVIFITGLYNTEAEEEGLKLGAADYISKPFNPMNVKLRVRNQIMIVERIRSINNMCITDQLTGIANRRGFDVHMKREWGRTLREKSPLGVLLIDADGFKNYNDTYGHQQGDVALQMIASAITSCMKRATDIAARWGGEEFIALLPNTDAGGTIEVGEKIRKKIEQIDIPLLNGDFTKLTVSVGANSIIPTLSCSVSEFIAKADKALYKAKQLGKNQVCRSGE
jgi:diguanylate cyclase (GGDEF)-like protein